LPWCPDSDRGGRHVPINIGMGRLII
jgi:hypothetical protein